MNETPATSKELFRKYGAPNPAPNMGQRVLVERGGKSDEAAFALGEVVSTSSGGDRQEGRVIVKEKSVYFADGRVSTVHRSPLTLPLDHFARSIQERMRERAARLMMAAQEYQQWAGMAGQGNTGQP